MTPYDFYMKYAIPPTDWVAYHNVKEQGTLARQPAIYDHTRGIYEDVVFYLPAMGTREWGEWKRQGAANRENLAQRMCDLVDVRNWHPATKRQQMLLLCAP